MERMPRQIDETETKRTDQARSRRGRAPHLQDYHLGSIPCDGRRRLELCLVVMIGNTEAMVAENTGELLIPVESLTPCAGVAPLHMIKRVCHVTMYRMKKMVDCVEDLVGDAVSKIRVSPIMGQPHVALPSAHDLRREPLAVFLFLENATGIRRMTRARVAKRTRENHTVTSLHECALPCLVE
jgi:hypothetical protein